MYALQQSIARDQRALLARIAAFDETKSWELDGCYSMSHWLAKRYGLSTYNARLWVKAAHALQSLPLIAGALELGTLGIDKVVQLARFATQDSEQDLLEWARRVTVATIRERADLARRIEISDVQDAEARRRLWWQPSDDALSLNFWGELPAADGAVFIKAIEREAQRLADEKAEDDGNLSAAERYERTCADALVALAQNRLSTDPDPDRATIVVRTELSALDHNARTEDGAVLHPETVARLRCDGRLEFVLTDGDDRTVGIGRASRIIPAWLYRELKRRDHHRCTFPGCDRKAFLQGHHIVPWEVGGPTDLDNLILVCHHHHKLVHEGGWSVELQSQVAHWKDPRGSPITAGV